jgi:hypothetical protein
MLLFRGMQTSERPTPLDGANSSAINAKTHPETHVVPDDKVMPNADFSNELAATAEMSTVRSELTQHFQRKEFSVSTKNQTFLEQAREALMFARLGVDKDKIDQIKAKMAELQALYAEGKISEQDLQAQMDALQSQLSEELQEAQARREQSEQKELIV